MLFGEALWERTPTDGELALFHGGGRREHHVELAALVEAATRVGFRPLRVHTATPVEWEDFESAHLAAAEAWLMAHAGEGRAEGVRASVEAFRQAYLRVGRRIQGLAYLLLGRPRGT
ncbi:hypothetical protein AB0I72_08250 [Nocardiopsis sp. NPDC049922]|uniref:hypothetical protein n=1 Tax=Nocardiopsis sp. NPDC049922 TaxID=3155157 RepID=UPI0033FE8ACF